MNANTGRAVLVTGASRGLGAAIALEAARLGARVVLAARSEAGLKAQAQAIQAEGGQAVVVAGDVAQEEDCRRMVEAAVEHFGRLDALVNNGGIIEPISKVAEVDIAAWQRNLAVNVLGPLMLSQLCLPYLRASRGCIVNISSGSTTRAMPGWTAYSSAKAAINQLSRSLAAEEPQVTVLAVRPGIVDTAMQEEIRKTGRPAMAEEDYGRLLGMYQQGKLLPPELPGRAIACMALHAPREWSGEFISWDEERVQDLVRQCTQDQQV